MHCARPQDYHSLGLSHIQFHSLKVTPLTNPAKVTDQGLCYCNPDTWGWHNSHQRGVISITDQLIFQNGNGATATLTPGDGTTAIKVESSA